jgi:CRISPR-associated RAMP protein (TIGR02581 family)
MFHRFKNRIALSAVLKAETALYIGAGQESFSPLAVQGCVLKDGKGLPYIPGSSLKGVLRSFLESVTDSACERGACAKKLKDKKKRQTKMYELAAKPENKGRNGDELLAEYIASKAFSCIACRLFGSGVMAGKVKVADATLRTPGDWVGTDLRTSNAIDRDTHTTAHSALFDTETIPSGTEFAFRVIAENLTAEEAQYFGELFGYFAQGGIAVGGRSRAGLGGVSVAGDDLKITVSYLKQGEFVPVTEELPDIAIENVAKKLVAFLVGKEAVYV